MFEFFFFFQAEDGIRDLVRSRGLGDVYKRQEDERPRIAIVGKPNVGKSSIINKLQGNNRVIVSDIAGTTRDAIDLSLIHI